MQVETPLPLNQMDGVNLISEYLLLLVHSYSFFGELPD